MSNYVKLLNNLDKLKLTKIKENIDQYVELINNNKKDIIESLYELTNLELEFKDEKAITALVRMAGFPYLKTFEDFDFSFQPTINKEQIMSHTWSIGETKYTNDDLSEQINNENATQSKKHSVGMITSSEYLRTNSNKSQCKTELLLYDNSATCKTTTWLYNIVDGNGLWLISNSIRGILGIGNFAGMTNWYNSNNQNGVAPVLYLSSEVKITGGDGSQSNPYTIS